MNTLEKKNIAILFGGISTEHEVSIMSVLNVINGIDKDSFDIYPVGITKEGKWLYVENIESIENGSWYEEGIEAVISPDATKKALITSEKEIKIDVAFPVLHGKYGEDGTIQGLLEIAGIPYVGCGVLSSAISMDKLFTKIIAENLKIRQAKFVGVRSYELKHIDRIIEKVEEELEYPVFVKPSNAGSSVGITKAKNRENLVEALNYAAQFDSKILVEEFINGREVECAVIGGGSVKPLASGIGEILSGAEFYDYDAKYNSLESKTIIDPDFNPEVVEEIRRKAVEIFNAVEGFGLSRVDFFVVDNTEVVFNEINTLPGFTAISLYPKLFEARGKDLKTLVNELIELAFIR